MDKLIQIQHDLDSLSETQRESVVDWLQAFVAAHHSRRVAEPRSAYTSALPLAMTLDEYNEFEEQSEYRHEYVNGFVYAMNGPSVAHARIATALVLAVGSHLRGGPCHVFSTDLKLEIRTDSDEIIYYPDLMVACQPDQWGKDRVRNPKLIGEILSPSTQHIDRREKAMAYRRIASMEEYLLLAQDEHKVIVQRRKEGWRPMIYAGADAVAELRSIGLSVPLAQVYEGIL